MNPNISVMVVEDNVEYRSAVALAMENEPGIQLSNQFGTAEVALRFLRENDADSNPIDIILLDIRLPGRSGLDSISEMLESSPKSKIIVLTQSNHEKDVLKAISAGASGYLLKSATLTELVSGIRAVSAGNASLDTSVAKFILDTLHDRLSVSEHQSLLSGRETEVLQLLAKGLVKKEIAKQLEIGYTTVDTHVGRIYAKLSVNNAPSAVNKAHLLKLFKTDDDDAS